MTTQGNGWLSLKCSYNAGFPQTHKEEEVKNHENWFYSPFAFGNCLNTPVTSKYLFSEILVKILFIRNKKAIDWCAWWLNSSNTKY